MSRRDWATAVDGRDETKVDAAGDIPQDVHTALNVSTANLGAVGDVDWTAGDARTVLAVSALVRSPRRRVRAPANGASQAGARRMHTLELIGELDRISATLLEREIERLCEEGVGGVTLDLRRLTYIDRTGVSVVAFRSRLCCRRGFDFALIPGPPRVQREFARAGLLERLPFRQGGSAAEVGMRAM
jgi:anti-anti-sigma factor